METSEIITLYYLRSQRIELLCWSLRSCLVLEHFFNGAPDNFANSCISGTHEAHSSYRVMPVAVATGHAAGVCAALAARYDTTPRAVPVREV